MTTSAVPLPVRSEIAVARGGRRMSASVMAMALMIGLAACGGGSSDSDPAGPPPAPGPGPAPSPGPAPGPAPGPTPSPSPTPGPAPGPVPPTASKSCLAYPFQTGEASGSLAGKASSPGGNAIFTKVSEPARGTVVMNANGVFTYTRAQTSPSRGDLDTFDYQVSDPSTGLTARNTVEVIYGSRRIMPLGDSLTSGIESDTPGLLPTDSQRVGYRLALYDRLVAEGYSVDFVGGLKNGAAAGLRDPDHEGHGGFSQVDVADRVDGWLNQNPADVVLLHIGTNDLPAQADPTSTVLSNINAWANDPLHPPVQVLLAKIISRRTAPNTRDQAVDAFNADLTGIYNTNWADRAAHPRLDVRLVDMNASLDSTTDMSPSAVDPGGLHPTRSGYDKMAAAWFDFLKSNQSIYKCD